jgi:cellulose synthase/poly-beta-1,6-N-acetylglucosamine synthase-like glycosyltransferase
LSIARNTGIRHSKGDLIAFTDDDAVVHPGWIGQLAGAFADPEVMAVTGLVFPAELETESQMTFEKKMGFHRGYRAITYDAEFFREQRAHGVHVWRIGAGVNMAVRRKALEDVGGFDERLGAGAAGCAEDSELWYRILARGWKCRYEPLAVVSHYHRRERKDLEQQARLYMRGHGAALLVQWARHRHRGNLMRLFVYLPAYFVRRLVGSFFSPEARRESLWSFEVHGFLSSFAYYFRNRRRGGAPDIL